MNCIIFKKKKCELRVNFDLQRKKNIHKFDYNGFDFLVNIKKKIKEALTRQGPRVLSACQRSKKIVNYIKSVKNVSPVKKYDSCQKYVTCKKS